MALTPHPHLTLFLLLLTTATATATATATTTVATGTTATTAPINSNSILIALLDSRYTELSELVEKALLLQTLEFTVVNHNITVFAPTNEAIERDISPEFKRFLLEPRNLRSLQSLVLHHVVRTRVGGSVGGSRWPNETTPYDTLSDDRLHLMKSESVRVVDHAVVVGADDVVRNDGIIHGIGGVLVPKSVVREFNARRSLRVISAVKPEGAPEVDVRTNRLKSSVPVRVGSPPALPVYYAMAPGPSLAPAPAPGPGGAHHHFDGESQVKDFIHTLMQYGGYNELADILVNLTNLATEMGKLVSEGYVLTVLAPNDEAMAKLTTDQLTDPGAPENIMYYHIIPEYQTEESMYNAVRRFKKVQYDTLHVPHKLVAREADGSVKFGEGEETAYLFDPDIYTDGRISVQGIDGVLVPVTVGGDVKKTIEGGDEDSGGGVKGVGRSRRGKLLEVVCSVLMSIGQESRFRTCHNI